MHAVFEELDLRDGIDWFTPFSPSETADIRDPQRTNTLPVSLGGRDYVLDLDQYQRQTLPQFRNAQDPSKEPGEQTLSVEGVWKRTQFGWHRGAGQEFADDDESDRLRFWTSRHVDVWTKRRVCLLPDTDSIYTGPVNGVLVAGVHVYVRNGSNNIYAAEIANSSDLASPTWVSQTNTYGALDMATDGDHVFLACGNAGVYVLDVGTPGDVLLDDPLPINADKVWFANGWLLVANGNRLETLAADGSRELVYEHLNDGWTWMSVTGGPSAIYALGRDSVGTKSEIYRLVLSETADAIVLGGFAGDTPVGEVANAIFYYQSRILVGTDQGVRTGAIDNGGSLSIGPVVLVGEVVDFAAYGRFVYAAGTPGLYRFDISNETEALVPAYASDLEAASDPDEATAVISTVMGIMFVDTDLWAIAPDRYCAEGTITSGWFGMGSPERKVLSSGSVRAEPLPGDGLGDDATIEMAVEDDANTSITIGVLDLPGARDPGQEWGGQNLDSELLRITLTLRATAVSQAQSPCVHRQTMRMLIAPVSTEQIVAPLLMADKVGEKGGGAQRGYADPFDEYRFLKQLEESRQVVNYREGQITYRVTVRDVGLEKPHRWTNKRRFLAGVISVRLVTEAGIPPETGSND